MKAFDPSTLLEPPPPPATLQLHLLYCTYRDLVTRYTHLRLPSPSPMQTQIQHVRKENTSDDPPFPLPPTTISPVYIPDTKLRVMRGGGEVVGSQGLQASCCCYDPAFLAREARSAFGGIGRQTHTHTERERKGFNPSLPPYEFVPCFTSCHCCCCCFQVKANSLSEPWPLPPPLPPPFPLSQPLSGDGGGGGGDGGGGGGGGRPSLIPHTALHRLLYTHSK